ncbi:MAG TPA: TldD/PmbA family protein [Bryobacteraceae bacterium]|nr:TldD/PmbA family protein [Bryobacteraceae bacterium]
MPKSPTESELLSRHKCQEIFAAVQQAAIRAGVGEVEITLTASKEALTRFANNEIHQNVAERSNVLSIRPVIGQRTARASTNRLHRDGIQAALDEAVALTRLSEPLPDLLPLFGEAGETLYSCHSETAAGCTPADRASAVARAIGVVEEFGQTAAGIYSTAENVEALLNSNGVFRYYTDTLTQFSITAMSEDSSGWAKASSPVHESVDPVALARKAALKARLSANPAEVPPGNYTVVLEPAAVLDLVGQIFGDFSGTAVADKRSFLNDREGDTVFGPNITIVDDVGHPLQNGAPFDGEGVLRQPLTLVSAGQPRDLAYSRAAAQKAGKPATGHGFALPNDVGEAPVNIVMAGGNLSIDDLIRSTSEGILVTRLWYIREVEPYEKVMTGMTRDGTFRIRNGEVVGGLRNFRFNQSVVELLRNVESLSESVRASGEEAFDMVVPALKAHGFGFTEVTKF